MRKGVDGGYGESVFIGIWVEGIEPLMRRLARPYFRVGFTLSVCLSVCLSVILFLECVVVDEETVNDVHVHQRSGC